MPPREAIALLEDALAQIEDLNAKAALHSLEALLDDRDLQANQPPATFIMPPDLPRIARVVRRRALHDPEADRREAGYWMTRPIVERLAHVEALREMMHGPAYRLQGIARVVQRREC